VIVRGQQQCPKVCPDKTVVLASQQCPSKQPPSWISKFFPMTSDTLPNWGALFAVIAVLVGAGTAFVRYRHAQLVEQTRSLLAMKGSMDTPLMAAADDELEFDGPPIRLRGYLGPEET